MAVWCDVFLSCHAVTSMGIWRTAWPDGSSYWEQDALVVAMFHIVREELIKEMNADGERKRH